nr:MAG TPA: hypothetical protein [Caudoviricetes sp.]
MLLEIPLNRNFAIHYYIATPSRRELFIFYDFIWI